MFYKINWLVAILILCMGGGIVYTMELPGTPEETDWLKAELAPLSLDEEFRALLESQDTVDYAPVGFAQSPTVVPVLPLAATSFAAYRAQSASNKRRAGDPAEQSAPKKPHTMQEKVRYAVVPVRQNGAGDKFISLWIRIRPISNCRHQGKLLPCNLVLYPPQQLREFFATEFSTELTIGYPKAKVSKSIYRKIIEPTEYIKWGAPVELSVKGDGWTLINIKLPKDLPVQEVAVPQCDLRRLKAPFKETIVYELNPLINWYLEITPRHLAPSNTAFDSEMDNLAESENWVDDSATIMQFPCKEISRQSSCSKIEHLYIDFSAVQPSQRARARLPVDEIKTRYRPEITDSATRSGEQHVTFPEPIEKIELFPADQLDLSPIRSPELPGTLSDKELEVTLGDLLEVEFAQSPIIPALTKISYTK